MKCTEAKNEVMRIDCEQFSTLIKSLLGVKDNLLCHRSLMSSSNLDKYLYVVSRIYKIKS